MSVSSSAVVLILEFRLQTDFWEFGGDAASAEEVPGFGWGRGWEPILTPEMEPLVEGAAEYQSRTMAGVALLSGVATVIRVEEPV